MPTPHLVLSGLVAIATLTAGTAAPDSLHRPRAAHCSVTIGDQLHVVAGGDQQDIYADHWALQGGEWTERAPLPEPRLFAAMTSLADHPILLGGMDHDNEWHAEVFRYDPEADTWDALPPMPSGRNRFAACELDGLLYAIGGYELRDGEKILHSASMDRFDPATGEWHAAPPMPTGRHGHTAEVVAGRLYVIGGYTENGQTAAVDVFDPQTNEWTSAAPMPQPNGFHMTAVHESLLYVVGGRVIEPSPCLVYDPEADAWQRLEPMPGIRGRGTAEFIGDELQVLGGEDREGKTYSIEQPLRFDTTNQTWRAP